MRRGIAAFKTRRVAVSSDGGLIKKRALTPQQRESMIPFFSSLIVPPKKKNSWGKLFFKTPCQSVFSQKWTLLQTRRDLGSQGDLADIDRNVETEYKGEDKKTRTMQQVRSSEWQMIRARNSTCSARWGRSLHMNACTFNAVFLEHTQHFSHGVFIELHPVAL